MEIEAFDAQKITFEAEETGAKRSCTGALEVFSGAQVRLKLATAGPCEARPPPFIA